MTAATRILIVNYNAGEALLECLRALRRSRAAGLETLIVDNASSDGSPGRVAREFPDVELLRLEENHGFAGGVNAGFARLGEETRESFERLLILNPDTLVAPDFLGPLEQALDRGASVAGPKLLLPGTPPRIWCAGGEATFGLNLSRLRGHGHLDRGQWDRHEDVSFLPATVWLMTRSCFEELGGLDERFFCYLEDLDFCVRARAAGRRLAFVPDSAVVHEGSGSSGGGYTPLRKYLNAHGSWWLLRKHGSLVRWLKFLGCDVATAPLAVAGGSLLGRGRASWWKLVGLWDGFRRRPLRPDLLRCLVDEARS